MVRPSDEPPYEEAKKDIGANIRRAREAAGLSRSSVADRMSVTDGMVGHWESGRHVPPWDRIARLSRIIAAKPHEILEPILGKYETSNDLTVPEARREVDAALRRLDRAMRDRDAE